MPSSMNWVDGLAGGTPVSAANLSKLAVTADVGTAGTPTGDAIRATSLPKWKPNTAYASGEFVVNPSGQIVQANTAFTSGATYSAGNWNPLTQAAGAYTVAVVHGSNAATARPSTTGAVLWTGSVQPSNWIDGDAWDDTSS